MGCREVFVLRNILGFSACPEGVEQNTRPPPPPLVLYLPYCEPSVCRPRGRFTELCASLLILLGSVRCRSQVLLLLASNQNRRRLLNSFHLICCSSGPRQTDWSSALPREVAAGRTLFQRRRSSLLKSAPSTRGRGWRPRGSGSPCSRAAHRRRSAVSQDSAMSPSPRSYIQSGLPWHSPWRPGLCPRILHLPGFYKPSIRSYGRLFSQGDIFHTGRRGDTEVWALKVIKLLLPGASWSCPGRRCSQLGWVGGGHVLARGAYAAATPASTQVQVYLHALPGWGPASQLSLCPPPGRPAAGQPGDLAPLR